MKDERLSLLMKEYEPLVWTVVSGILGPRRRDAEEAAADVFISLWRDKRFDPDSTGAKAYIIKVAKRRAIDRLRAEGREKAIPTELGSLELEADSDSDPHSEASERINCRIIAEVISSLTPPDGEIFTRRYYYCQQIGEIAAALGLSKSYVKSRLERARGELREKLTSRNIIL